MPQALLIALLALCGLAPLQVWASCVLSRADEQVAVRHVSDGDTLVLADGRKVRLIGVNAPEMGDGSARPQPFAEEARRHVREFVARSGKVILQFGPEREDRHGRLLAHVFNSDGSSLEESLVRHGLAWRVAVGPGAGLTPCLAEAESAARIRQTGVWGTREYQVRKSGAEVEQGFQILRGKVKSVSLPRGRSWWIDLDMDVSLLIRKDDQDHFRETDLKALVGREVEVRGWVVPRRDRKGKQSRWLMPLSNPAAMSPVQDG